MCGADGTPDTDHPVLCATPRPQPSILPYATGKCVFSTLAVPFVTHPCVLIAYRVIGMTRLIKCGLHATELAGLVDPNATEPVRANSSSWLPMKLYFNPEEAALDVTRTYALVLQNCPLNECWLSAGSVSDSETDRETETDYELGTHTVEAAAGGTHGRANTLLSNSGSDALSAMEFRSGRWQPLPHTSVAATFYTAGSTEHGYRPNQLHSDWVAFHCNTTALEIKEVARFAATVPAYNSTNGKTVDVLAYLLRPIYMEYSYVEFVCKCIYVYFTYILDGAGTPGMRASVWATPPRLLTLEMYATSTVWTGRC